MTVLGQVYLSSLCQSGAGLLMVLTMLWIFGRGGGGGEGVLRSIFAGYVLLASQNPFYNKANVTNF